MPLTVANQLIVTDIDPTRTTDALSTAISLANGQLLLLAGEFSRTEDIRMASLDIATGAVSEARLVNTTTFGDQEQTEAVQLANGNILVAWTDDSATAPDFSGTTVRYQMFDAAGQPIGVERTAPVNLNDNQKLTDAVALNDGRFALTWFDDDRNASVFRLFNSDGSPSGEERVVPIGFGDLSGNNFTTSGTSGMAAVGVVNGLRDSAITVLRYTAAGNPSGDPIVVARGTGLDREQIVELADGGFAVVWTDSSLTPPFNKGPIVRAQIVDANGNLVGGQITLSDDIFSEHTAPLVTALDDGRFVVTWRQFPDNDFLSSDVVARIINADGSFGSDVVTVFDSGQVYDGIRGGVTTSLSSVSVLADGRLAYAFSALDPSGSQFRSAVMIVDPRDGVSGSSGADLLTGTAGADSMRGYGGDDTLLGQDGSDTVSGDDGNDSVQGGRGGDRLSGGTGDDTLDGGEGADTLDGGNGVDTLDYSRAASAVAVSLLTGTGTLGEAAGDTFANFERVIGSGFADRLQGGSGADTLRGDGGDDSLFGGSSADLLAGNDGADDIQAGSGADRVFGGAGNDTLRGESGLDEINGDAGADVLSGSTGHDTLRGGDDNDTLYGGDNNDLLSGNNGNDSLSGGTGNDRMFGGAGLDTLVGGAGQDALSGGADADVFVFSGISDSPHGSTRDTITDFEDGLDRIDLSGFAGTLTFVGSAFTGGGNQVRYDSAIGRLYIDIDGGGASDFSIDITTAPTITGADLIL